MKILKIILISIIGLGVILFSGAYIRNKMVGPEGWAMDDTKKYLRLHMKDPDSMAIRSSHTVVRVNPSTGAKNIYICGHVDGSNSYGAYGGALRFVSWSTSESGTFSLVSVNLEDPEDVAVSKRVGMITAFEKVYWAPHCAPEAIKQSS